MCRNYQGLEVSSKCDNSCVIIQFRILITVPSLYGNYIPISFWQQGFLGLTGTFTGKERTEGEKNKERMNKAWYGAGIYHSAENLKTRVDWLVEHGRSLFSFST